MKITIPRQTGTLRLPSDFATFLGFNSLGQFHYKVKYIVDAVKAINQKAYLVEISVSTASPDTRVTSFFEGSTTGDLVQGLLRQTANKIESYRGFSKGIISTIVSDLTSRFPNDKTRNLQNASSAAPLFQRKISGLVKASELTKNNISQPTHQFPLYQPEPKDVSTGISPTENANTLLFRYGIDPSIVGKKTHQVVDTQKALAGVFQNLGGIAKEVSLRAPLGSARPAFGLLAAATKRNERPNDQLGLANDEMILVSSLEETNELAIEEDLFLDSATIGDQFYLTFQLKDSKGIEIATTSVLVQHSRNFALFSLPVTPPSLTGKSCPGYNKLELKQLDENGAGVIIFRKTLDAHTASTDNGFVQVAKFPIRKGDGAKWYEDRFASTRPVVYRAITYNRQEIKSSEFSSVVLRPASKAQGIRSNFSKRKAFLSLHAKVLDQTIQLELNDIPPGTLALKVYRRDLTLLEKIEDAQQVGNVIFMPEFPTPDMRFYVTDLSPVNKRDYEYLVKLTYRDGTEKWANPPVQIRFNPVTNGILTTTSSPMRSIPIGNEQDIQFTLSTQITEGKLDQVRRAMAQQGILGFFQNDLVDNREKLQNLIAYHIKRTNLTTGEVEDMGVFMGSEFSDRVQGSGKGVQPAKLGCEYEYAITTHFRSSQTLLPTFRLTVENTVNPSRTYTYAPSKWQNPITLGVGNLVTPSTLLRNHATSEFTSGQVGSIIHLRLSLAEATPLIQNPTASPVGPGKVLVSWEVKGNVKEIDHFLITREELGMQTVVGKAHSMTDSKSIQFVDTIYEKKINIKEMVDAAVSYLITPVLYDYTFGAQIKTPQIIVKRAK